MATEWSKSHASTTRRFFASETGKALLEIIRSEHPKTKDATTTEHAALIGSRKEGREEVLEKIAELQEWTDPQEGDEGQDSLTL